MLKKIGVTEFYLPVGIRSLFVSAIAATPMKSGWKLLLYYVALVGVTDCIIWFMADSIAGYSWQTLVVYSLLAYPLWIIFALKGIGKEQIDLSENSRWHAVDLMPGGATPLLLGHHLGKVFKYKILYVWIFVFITLALINNANFILILIALANILVGSMILTIGGITFRYYAPKGYSTVLNSIFFNITWILSGAVFPLGMISSSPIFYILNPFSAAISTPLTLLQKPNELVINTMHLQLYTLSGAIIWLFLFIWISMRAERSQREKHYR